MGAEVAEAQTISYFYLTHYAGYRLSITFEEEIFISDLVWIGHILLKVVYKSIHVRWIRQSSPHVVDIERISESWPFVHVFIHPIAIRPEEVRVEYPRPVIRCCLYKIEHHVKPALARP